MRAHAGENGSILPLICGFFAVALALVLVTTSATSLYLERARLYTLADGAALAAAGSLALDLAATHGAGDAPIVDDARLRAAADGFVKLATATRATPVTLVSAESPDARGARVRVTTIWRPPVVAAFVPRGLRLEVEANARPVFE